MVTFAMRYCDKTAYDINGNIISRADGFGGDCAHFAARAVVAGACIRGPALTDSLWDYAAYVDPVTGIPYKLICTGGPNKCWSGPQFNINIGGIHEYLRDHGWINALRNPSDWESVTKACVVSGNPIGPLRGDWDHVAFGIGATRHIAAHSADYCDVDVAQVFESLNAVWCPPPSCQNCPPCVPRNDLCRSVICSMPRHLHCVLERSVRLH